MLRQKFLTKLIIYDKIISGGDPIIQPLVGQKFALAPHIKFVNLLADYSSDIFINAQIDMLNPDDFPKQIYWDHSFSESSKLTHIYFTSYYRKFLIYFKGDIIKVNADDLKIQKQNDNCKFKIANFKPKTGLKSISFDKTYPLFDSTKGIRIGFGNYLLTIMSDINTDDRHHIELLNTKQFNLLQTYGAFIDKNKIIRISSLDGPELFSKDITMTK